MKNKIYLAVFSDFHVEFSTLKESNQFNKLLDQLTENINPEISNKNCWIESVAKVLAQKMNCKILNK